MYYKFKRCQCTINSKDITYYDPSRNQEGKHINIHKIRGPGRGLVFADTGDDGDVLACICAVRCARVKV
jgi:hypothetical protein